jgi:hypothetical protein
MASTAFLNIFIGGLGMRNSTHCTKSLGFRTSRIYCWIFSMNFHSLTSGYTKTMNVISGSSIRSPQLNCRYTLLGVIHIIIPKSGKSTPLGCTHLRNCCHSFPDTSYIAVLTLPVTGKPKGNPSLYSILYYTIKMYEDMKA